MPSIAESTYVMVWFRRSERDTAMVKVKVAVYPADQRIRMKECSVELQHMQQHNQDEEDGIVSVLIGSTNSPLPQRARVMQGSWDVFQVQPSGLLRHHFDHFGLNISIAKPPHHQAPVEPRALGNSRDRYHNQAIRRQELATRSRSPPSSTRPGHWVSR